MHIGIVLLNQKLYFDFERNGNINWDDNFEFFCDFIGKTLSESGLFEDDRRAKIAGCISIIKSRGKYAYAYHSLWNYNDDLLRDRCSLYFRKGDGPTMARTVTLRLQQRIMRFGLSEALFLFPKTKNEKEE